MKVRNEGVYKRSEVQCFVEAMKWNLVVAVNITANNGTSEDGSTTRSKSDVVAAVQNVLKTCLNTELAPANNPNHENYDVTLTIPYKIGDDGYAVKCSLRW